MLKYECKAIDKKARAGTIITKHGSFDTPIFMPVGTVGTVKGLTPEIIKATGARVILGNTYHLMLRPGAERIARLGGLHKMMNWPGPILTDSGGFQVMSLAKLRKIDPDGVTFNSHIDGSRHRVTPERSIEIQDLLDATITMQLDECVANPTTYVEAERAMRLSLLWAERSKNAWRQRKGYGIFGIVQGSIFKDLRTISSRELVAMDFEGYAIGGLAVGEGQKAMFRVLDFSVELLPTHKPRYLMGVGTPDDLLGSVERGIDMFDCVMPTRAGRTGRAFTSQGILNIQNARFADDIRPLDPVCHCSLCQNYARGYLHHLFKAKEMLGSILLSAHNLTYYQSLMQQMRQAIIAGQLSDLTSFIRENWLKGDIFS